MPNFFKKKFQLNFFSVAPGIAYSPGIFTAENNKQRKILKNIETIQDYREKIDFEKINLTGKIRDEIKNIKDYNKRLNAFVTIFEQDEALKLSKINSKGGQNRIRKLPLFGIPLTIKDNIFLSGWKTTAASAAFQKFIPSVNADAVDLALSSGCVPLGKTNLHELAMGATSSSSFFGPVRNPIDPSRISGGSSGGSAVSVAMSKIPVVSIGTDTGGSVRIPAALCGVCGFKPTHGVISTSGVLPLGATLDHVGILTKNMPDMHVAFLALTRGEYSTKGSSGSRPKIGIPGSYFFEDCSPDVEKSFWHAVEVIREAGFAVLEDLEIWGFEKISRTRLTIQLAEAFWFYQDLVKDPQKRKLVGKDVLGFLERGAKIGKMEQMVSSSERISLISNVSRSLQEVDFIVMPTCLTTAPKLDDVIGKEAGSIRKQLVRNTELFNICGFPSLTIPANRLDSSELPTGIEISGRPLEDNQLLEAGERVWKLLHRGF